MKLLLSVTIIILLNSATSFGQYFTITQEGDPVPDTNKVLSREDLSGRWYSWGYIIDHTGSMYSLDSDYERVDKPVDLYFDNDSLWTFQYPCQRLSVQTYSSQDWILIGDELTTGRGRRYIRIDFDTTIVNRLKVEELIPECYSGKWVLTRTMSGGDGTGIEYVFPFKVNDTLVLKKEALIAPKLSGNIVSIFIGGAKREFYFSFKKEIRHKLILKPTESWSESENRMWRRWWNSPPLSDEEMKKIKETEGSELELIFTKIN